MTNMIKVFFNIIVIVHCVHLSSALLCYNCSSTHLTWNKCGGNFVKTSLGFNNSRVYLVNCTKENSMCFVRSWTARAKHSWIVQRGCYQTRAQDPFPRAMDTPTRAMRCRHERLAEADYKVCMCNADWCNSANPRKPTLKINGLYMCQLCIYIVYKISKTLLLTEIRY